VSVFLIWADDASNENDVEYNALYMKVTHTYIYSFTSRKFSIWCVYVCVCMYVCMYTRTHIHM